MNIVVNILLSMLGFSVFSAGIVLTKAGGAWLKWPGHKNRDFYKALAIWLLGFLLYNVAVVPNMIASKSLPPHIISAISGWGIPAVVLLSAWLLKEKLFKSDLINALLMFAAIIVLGLSDRSSAATQINQTSFYILLALPLVLLLPLIFRRPSGRLRAILLAAFAGSAGGLALVIMNIVVKSLGFDIFSYLDSPWPYLYILVSVAQFIGMQLAMRFGSMILVGPLQYALMILYPVAASYFVFQAALGVVQLIMIVLIVACCVLILRKH